ncbi:MAG: hypothetical protein ABR577_06815 [Pyrinomonadaceae bacterium]
METKRMNNKLRTKLLLAVLTIISGNISSLPARQIAGGYQAASNTDRQVVKAAVYAIRAEKRRQGMRVSLLSIERAETQVVAGINYKLCLRVKAKGKTQTIKAIVYENPKQKYSLSAWEVDNCKRDATL